jgi:hypothetical protein
MRRCDSCGEEMMRSHRSFLERLLFSEKFRCRNCRRPKWLLAPEISELVPRILRFRDRPKEE